MAKKEQKGIQKTSRLKYITHLCISSLSLIILAIGIGWYPYILSYQDKVYYTERAKYDAEKSQWDSIQTFNIKKAEDSVFNYWISQCEWAGRCHPFRVA